MGAQGQLTQGPSVPNPRTKYKHAKMVFAVTSIALIIGRDWSRLVHPLVQSLIKSLYPGRGVKSAGLGVFLVQNGRFLVVQNFIEFEFCL